MEQGNDVQLPLVEPVSECRVSGTRRQQSMVTDASWTLAGNVFYAVCTMGCMVLISKLSPDDSRGRYVFATATIAPIIAFAALGLRQMLATDVRYEHRFSDYLFLRLISVFVVMIVVASIAWTQPYAAALVLVVIGMAKSLESISDILFGRMQQFWQFDRIAQSQIIKGVATLACLAIGLFLTRDALGAAIGLGIGFFLSLLMWDVPLARKAARLAQATAQIASTSNTGAGVFFDSPARLGQFLRHAAPLAFATTLVAVNLNMPVYFLRVFYHEQGEALIGIYGALNYLPTAGAVLVTAIGVAASTRLATLYSRAQMRAFYSLVGRLVAVCAAIGVAAVVVALIAGKIVITVLFKKEDAAHWDVLAWLMVSGSLIYVGSILGYAVTATRKFHRFVIPYLAVTLVGAVASILLISGHDVATSAGRDAALTGAAWASCALSGATCLASTFILIVTSARKPEAKGLE